ncbi:MAG: MBL fold metallo-hydrolase [Planctomycetota bacterium]|mgnify:CR=1 FL=1|nr:MAG: MBL fold metallo-hydrolase [Planctomycetota bacterium]
MFHFDRGLKLTKADLAIDFKRRQPRAFVSHAHIDHMARHEYAICTPETAQLYRFRFGPRTTRDLPYGQPLEWGGMRLTTYPAGHCLGSAMLLAEDGDRSLLYTGDFKLGESATAARAELPRADVLVIESTYGQPFYRHPPREQVLDELFTRVREAIDRGATPVIEAYVLGKSQEVTRLLTLAGFPVLQHPRVYAISQVYCACGVDLGDCHQYPGHPLPGHVAIVPPRMHRAGRLPGLRKTVTFAVTGWAMHERTRFRLGVDHAIPLSDHADYDELFETVERVDPKVVYCTHGPASFVEHLRKAGVNARPLDQKATGVLPPVQGTLF